MWGRPILRDYPDLVEIVGLCDINPLRVEVAKKQMGASCPTFTNFDDMLTKAKPDVVMVTTVDAFHSQYLVRAMERGVDVMTEKPMVIDEAQCRAVLDAEKKTGRKIVVTHNYRYAPKHQKIKELLMGGEIGKITSVDFTWFLDTTHGADYFRRWHRLRSKSGSLWVHKASHHFDLVNWWIDAEPVQVSALGSLANYGKSGPFRHTNCRPCPHKDKCSYYWDINKSREPRRALQRLRVGRRLSARRLRLQGRHRHLRHDERGRAVLERRQHELLGQHVHADRGLLPRVQRHARAGSRCATTSARRGIPAKRPRCT